MADEEIELRLKTEHTEHDLLGQAGIARVDVSGSSVEQIGRIAAAVDVEQVVEGDLSRSRQTLA